MEVANLVVNGGVQPGRAFIVTGNPAFVLRIKGLLEVATGARLELRGANQLKIGPEE
jgi:hypothetical protein